MDGKLETQVRHLREAARAVRRLGADEKNRTLLGIADALVADEAGLLEANASDVAALDAATLPSYRDRLTLTPARVAAMAESLRQVAHLPDPVGEVTEARRLPNGLNLRRVRSPLGVIFMIFESRPNVALEAFSLAFKAGNAIVLRGGRESARTVAHLYRIMGDAFANAPPFLGVTDYDRAHVTALLKRKDLIDVVVPRGGDKLIAFVEQTAAMPIIKNDRGMCHAFVDAEADLGMAVRIVVNGKTQRPGVCNALETVLVHRAVADDFIPRLYDAAPGLSWRVDQTAERILAARTNVTPADDASWDTEYLDLILNCRVVEGFDEAVAHIERHGSRHSETIVTANPARARDFQSEIDAAAVYWNASTRFTDGFEMGLGGELGISTQKLHVRGPVGLRELTTPRWLIDGDGQTRA